MDNSLTYRGHIYYHAIHEDISKAARGNRQGTKGDGEIICARVLCARGGGKDNEIPDVGVVRN